MAALKTTQEVMEEIAVVSRAAARRIVRLPGGTKNAYIRLIAATRGNKKTVVAAVDRYLLAARRVERHADPATKAAFATADSVLTKHLHNLTDPDMDLLRRELALRRIVVLTDPAVLEKEFRAAMARAAGRPARRQQRLAAKLGRDGADLHAAALQQKFFGRVREVAAEGAATWTLEQRRLLRGCRKLQTVYGDQWAECWESTFSYARNHAVGIASRGRELRSAQVALDEARHSGTVVEIRPAEARVAKARRRVNGYMSKIKGLLGESYVPLSKDWRLQVASFLRVARREAAARPGRWAVRRVVGSVRINGLEVWDEAILLVRKDASPPLAELFLAAQFKVEKKDSALRQIRNDVLRETASTGSGSLPLISFASRGKSPEAFLLSPPPPGKPSHRYVFNASGGHFAEAEVARLRATGIEVNQFTLDISVAEMDSVAQALVQAVVDAAGP